MKRSLFHSIALTGVLLAGSLSASAAETVHVKVPFSFVLGGLEFQPGEYSVHSNSNGLMTVQGVGHAAMVLTVPTETSKSGATALRFQGQEHRLIGVQVQGEVGRAIKVSDQERKLMMATR